MTGEGGYQSTDYRPPPPQHSWHPSLALSRFAVCEVALRCGEGAGEIRRSLTRRPGGGGQASAMPCSRPITGESADAGTRYFLTHFRSSGTHAQATAAGRRPPDGARTAFAVMWPWARHDLLAKGVAGGGGGGHSQRRERARPAEVCLFPGARSSLALRRGIDSILPRGGPRIPERGGMSEEKGARE